MLYIPINGLTHLVVRPHSPYTATSTYSSETPTIIDLFQCKTIDCGDEVTHEHINQEMQNTSCCESDGKLMHRARSVLTTESKWVCKHLHLTCYGEHVTYTFVSGDKTNRYVVQLNEDGKISSEWAEKGWTLWAKDTVTDTVSTIWQYGDLLVPSSIPGKVLSSLVFPKKQ